MEWVRGAKIGEGSFGTVNLAKPRSNTISDTCQLWAVKSCSASSSASLSNEKRILDELKDCPEIIQCYGDCYTYEDNEKLYNVFLEYASEGSLYRKIKNSDCVRLPESEVRRYTKGIVRGLNYIHKNGFVHCDIKLQNILFNQDGEIKIADFGLAKRIGGKSGCEIRGTPMYMSPEMVTGGDQVTAADIWALGCLVSEMFTGAPVWKCSELPELLFRIGGSGAEMPEMPENLSEEGKDFLSKCFVKDPEMRWTAEMLLSHPFLADDDHHHNNGLDELPSTSSPTSAFDFPEWVPQESTSSSPEQLKNSDPWYYGDLNSCYGLVSDSLVDRLQRLVSHHQQCDWLAYDDWVSVR